MNLGHNDDVPYMYSDCGQGSPRARRSSTSTVFVAKLPSANRALGDSTLETATRSYGALPEIVGKTRDVRRLREFVGADCSARTFVEFDNPL